MTTLFSTPSTSGRVSIAPGGSRGVALRAMQGAVGTIFVGAGCLKFAGAPAAVAVFDAVGLGQWFRYVVASIEVASGLALFVPSLAPYGAVLLIVTMAGAIVAHQFFIPGSPVAASVLLMASLGIAVAHRDRLAGPPS